MNHYIIKGPIIVAALIAAGGGQAPVKQPARAETKPAPAPQTKPA